VPKMRVRACIWASVVVRSLRIHMTENYRHPPMPKA